MDEPDIPSTSTTVPGYVDLGADEFSMYVRGVTQSMAYASHGFDNGALSGYVAL